MHWTQCQSALAYPNLQQYSKNLLSLELVLMGHNVSNVSTSKHQHIYISASWHWSQSQQALAYFKPWNIQSIH